MSEYKSLGVLGVLLKCRKHIVSQAFKALYLLYERSNNLCLTIGLQLKWFDNTILPILTYGCEAYGYDNLNELEQIHLDFLRKTLLVPKRDK